MPLTPCLHYSIFSMILCVALCIFLNFTDIYFISFVSFLLLFSNLLGFYNDFISELGFFFFNLEGKK